MATRKCVYSLGTGRCPIVLRECFNLFKTQINLTSFFSSVLNHSVLTFLLNKLSSSKSNQHDVDNVLAGVIIMTLKTNAEK